MFNYLFNCGPWFNLSRLFLGIILLLLCHQGLAQNDFHRFSKIPLTETFNTIDYDGGIQNWGIAQDKRGFIYVANNFGLLEFDGETWRRYVIENNTRVRSVFVDQDNRIYIGGQNQFGYFEPNPEGQLTFHSLLPLLPPERQGMADIWKIFRHNDQILFNSIINIAAYDGEQCVILQKDQDVDLIFQVASGLYAFSPAEGLLIRNGDHFNKISGSQFLTRNSVTSILPYKSNSILIFQNNGQIYRYHEGRFIRWRTPADEFLEASLINTAHILKNQNIAIGTQNNGLLILSPEGKPINHLTKGKGLNNRTVLSLFEDQFNNLWVGLNNGITLVELGSPFSIIDEQSGLPGTGYCATLFDNKLYLGTSNGLFYQHSNPDPLSANSSYKLIENSKGQVYNVNQLNENLFLAHHNGAFQVVDEQAIQISGETGTWKFDLAGQQDKLLAGTYSGFDVFEKEQGVWKKSEDSFSFYESSRVFEFTGDSTLWMTHGYLGAYRIVFDRDFQTIRNVTFYGAEHGFPANILINVFNLGNRLVFPAETGIFEYDAKKDGFTHVEELEKYLGANNHISELTADLMGNIYFISNAAIGFLEKNSFGEYVKHSEEFSKIRKYLSDDLENISVIDHQNVFFGAKEGFIHFNPSIKNYPGQPFACYIRSVDASLARDTLIYGGSGALPKNASFSADLSSIRFQFSSPFFEGHNELLYQYQMENFDKGWSEWLSTTEKEYTNLPHGTYRFRVRAKNIYNTISSEAIFSFRIFPPWYKTSLAYFFYALSLICIFGFSMFLLDKKHKKERRKLTIHQKRELLKKESEIVEVSKKSEAEISKLRNDKLRAEVDHKNRELATTTMHLINKNEFMVSLKDTLQGLSKNGSKDSLKKVIRDIDRNLAEDEGWEQFTRHFDQVHGDFLKNLKDAHPTLTPQEIKLCAYLRMNMSSKEIANLLNISVRGVEISRYRLRKKLEIDRETNLVDYMLEYS